MKLDKSAIIDLLRSKGDHGKADQAEKELPDQVDHEQHANLLSKLGLDVPELLEKLPGGMGKKLEGGLGGLLGGDDKGKG